jgi:hypothetical protein
MVKKAPERKPVRRIAVILGSGGSSKSLLEQALPLLGSDRNIEMQGVFLEEAEVQHAAELPFVKELCRVTFSVREFTSDQFEHALALRMRSAQRALSVLARRTGVTHSFRNVRGSAIALVRETAEDSDVTLFGPAGMRAASVATSAESRRARHRIVVLVDEGSSGRRALRVAAHLANGDPGRITAILTPAAAESKDRLEADFHRFLPGARLHSRTLEAATPAALVEAVRAEAAALLVIGISEQLVTSASLQALRDRLDCPICLVRGWAK